MSKTAQDVLEALYLERMALMCVTQHTIRVHQAVKKLDEVIKLLEVSFSVVKFLNFVTFRPILCPPAPLQNVSDAGDDPSHAPKKNNCQVFILFIFS